MHYRFKILMFTLPFLTCFRCSSSQGGVPDTEAQVIAQNLEVPWAIDFLPDNRLIFTERTGTVKIVAGDSITEAGKLDVATVSEAGLLGLAVDPQFAQNQFIYLYYTYRSDGSLLNRLSRFSLNDSIHSETVLIDSIPGDNIHDGGGVQFGPDGLLYVTTGDAGQSSLSQDTNSLAGKILRLQKDGTIPADNPFGTYVYALGLRNCQGLAWSNGTLYAIDHGPSRHDEINIIEKGGNYHWPRTCDETPAFRCFTEFTLAPAGIVAVDDFLFVTGLRGSQLRKINLQTGDETPLFTNLGRLRPVTIHEGFLYFGTSNRDGRGTPNRSDDRIFRIPLNKITQFNAG